LTGLETDLQKSVVFLFEDTMHIAKGAPKRPALRYYGGKWKLAPWIISFFPPHQNYVEPCGGAASVLLQKPRSPLETYNDLDGNVVNFFRVLRDRPDELIWKIRLTPWARAEYELSLEECEDEVERARRFWVSMWMSMQGGHHSKTSKTWRMTTNVVGRDTSDHPYITTRYLVGHAGRFDGIQIDNRDARDVVARYDNGDALIYFDPPYLQETRSQGDRYRLETGTRFHIESAQLLRQAQGYVIVSGYACPLYAELYEDHGWARFDKEAQTNSGGKRIESVWLSPRTLEALGKHEQVKLF
jgi:DNA adenine methylase